MSVWFYHPGKPDKRPLEYPRGCGEITRRALQKRGYLPIASEEEAKRRVEAWRQRQSNSGPEPAA